jgi:hypothetical protein
MVVIEDLGVEEVELELQDQMHQIQVMEEQVDPDLQIQFQVVQLHTQVEEAEELLVI